MRRRTVPAPTATRGRVVVRVHATSINLSDVISRQVRFPRFPRGTGMDFTGEVVETGPGINDLNPGQRVWGYLGGLSTLPMAAPRWAWARLLRRNVKVRSSRPGGGQRRGE